MSCDRCRCGSADPADPSTAAGFVVGLILFVGCTALAAVVMPGFLSRLLAPWAGR